MANATVVSVGTDHTELHTNSQEVNRSMLLRSGAVVAIVANVALGFLFPDHGSLSAPLSPLFVPLNLASLVGVTLLLFGLPGWYEGRSESLGRGGTLGLVLVALTLLFAGVFMNLYQVVVLPMAATDAQVFINPGPTMLLPVLIFGVVTEIVGPFLLGWSLLRQGLGPRWAAWTLLVSAPATVLWFASLLMDGYGTPSPFTIVSNIVCAALLFIGLGGLAVEPLERRVASAVRSPA
jgi:hypothetical protein